MEGDAHDRAGAGEPHFRALGTIFGREQAVEEIRTLLNDPTNRLVTLTGPAGVGKTRLALEVLREPPSGRVPTVVPLAPMSDVAPALISIGEAIGTVGGSDRPVLERIAELLAPRTDLLVLDNLEHLPGLTEPLAWLLDRCPALQILATSRVALRTPAELTYSVEPLPLPVSSFGPAVALFVERAREADPRGTLTVEPLSAVAEICRRLDGLPLAIELAAARCRSLGVSDLAARLERRLPLLGERPGDDRPERHRTLRAAISWSYDLLEPEAQALLRRLSLFPAGCQLDAAEAVSAAMAGENERGVVLDAIEALVDANLVQRRINTDGHARFTLLETVLEFGLERLADAGERTPAYDALVTWALERLEGWQPAFYGPGQASWLAAMDADRENFRAAITWTIERRDIERALRLMTRAMWMYWGVRGLLRDEGTVLDEVLDLLDDNTPTDPALVAAGWSASAVRRHELGDVASARTRFERALAIRREIGDQFGIANTLNNLGNLVEAQGDNDEADGYFAESIAIRREIGEPRLLTTALINRAGNAIERGDPSGGQPMADEALQIAEGLGDYRAAAYALVMLARIALAGGDAAAGLEHSRQAVALQRALGDKPGLGQALAMAGRSATRSGATGEAAALLEEALAVHAEIGFQREIADDLEDLASLTMRSGVNPSTQASAVRFLGAASAIRERIGIPVPLADRPSMEALLADVRNAMSSAEFRVGWATGEQRTLAEAVAAGRATAREIGAATTQRDRPAGKSPSAVIDGRTVRISRREVEVLRLLAEGQTDREIAEALFLSTKTVSNHVGRILTDLGVATRTAAAVRAVRFGLI